MALHIIDLYALSFLELLFFEFFWDSRRKLFKICCSTTLGDKFLRELVGKKNCFHLFVLSLRKLKLVGLNMHFLLSIKHPCKLSFQSSFGACL
jgi:hypothetical protein